MQIDNMEQKEGFDESGAMAPKNDFDLRQHFLDNGLSQKAYSKIAEDINSGDMNKGILIKCSDEDISNLAKEMGFTFLQTKAFKEGIKSLKTQIGNTRKQFENSSNKEEKEAYDNDEQNRHQNKNKNRNRNNNGGIRMGFNRLRGGNPDEEQIAPQAPERMPQQNRYLGPKGLNNNNNNRINVNGNLLHENNDNDEEVAVDNGHEEWQVNENRNNRDNQNKNKCEDSNNENESKNEAFLKEFKENEIATQDIVKLLGDVDRDVQEMCNPYVIIVGIEDYTLSHSRGRSHGGGRGSMYPAPQESLNSVNVDVERMRHLWSNVYNYKNMCVALAQNNNNNSSSSNNRSRSSGDNAECLTDRQTFRDFLVRTRNREIERYCDDNNNTIDGLIFYYAGHGVQNNRIVLQNGQKFKISEISEIFNLQNCESLRKKPKLMIFDCCRGSEISSTISTSDCINNNNNSGKFRGATDWVHEKFHVESGTATIFSNFETYVIMESPMYGGCLTRAIETVFKHPKLIEKYSLRKLIVAIRRQTKLYSGSGQGSQLVDFHEGLEYLVYFKRNDAVVADGKNTNKNKNKNNNMIPNNNNTNKVKIESGIRKDENRNGNKNRDTDRDRNRNENRMGPLITWYDFGRIEIRHNGELKRYGQGRNRRERADFIFWNDKYEKWNWKNADTYVDTHLKRPLLHSPGITWKLVQYMINNSNHDETKGLQKLIFSQGFGVHGINSTTPGQLPCPDKVLKKIEQDYPGLVVVNCKSKEAIKAWNDAMTRNERAAMCLHMTC